MNTATQIHHKSLEFSDDAFIAKRKGDDASAKILYEKAFLLEKEAALRMQKDIEVPFSKLIMIRSAAVLAYKAGLYQEALKLIALGLEEFTEKEAVIELNPILEQLKKRMPEINSQHQLLKGVLTAANAKENEIKVENIENKQVYSMMVPAEMMDKIVKSYWKDEVVVEFTAYTGGVMVLNKISLAA